jgi:zinc transporter ZupT
MDPGNPVFNAFLATIFTWLMTLAGAALVFLPLQGERKLLDSSLGFAAGIMIAASFWSLLVPAIELSPRCMPGFLRLLDSLQVASSSQPWTGSYHTFTLAVTLKDCQRPGGETDSFSLQL